MNTTKKKIAMTALPLFLGAILLAATLSTDSAVAEVTEEVPYKVEVKKFELSPMPKIQGSVDITKIVKSSIKTIFSDAARTASQSVDSGMVTSGSLTTIQGYSVYSFDVTDSKDMTYNIIIDVGNGKILYKSEAMEYPRFGSAISGISNYWHGANVNHGPVMVKAFPASIENP